MKILEISRRLRLGEFEAAAQRERVDWKEIDL